MKRIIWTKLSQRTRKEIFEYWNNRNKSKLYSWKLNILFNETAKLISQFSEIGIITEWEGVRAKSVKDYFIFYTYDAENVYILLIWDARRNPDLLNKIFN